MFKLGKTWERYNFKSFVLYIIEIVIKDDKYEKGFLFMFF